MCVCVCARPYVPCFQLDCELMRATAEWLQHCGHLPFPLFSCQCPPVPRSLLLTVCLSVTTLECLLSLWATSELLGVVKYSSVAGFHCGGETDADNIIDFAMSFTV